MEERNRSTSDPGSRPCDAYLQDILSMEEHYKSSFESTSNFINRDSQTSRRTFSDVEIIGHRCSFREFRQDALNCVDGDQMQQGMFHAGDDCGKKMGADNLRPADVALDLEAVSTCEILFKRLVCDSQWYCDFFNANPISVDRLGAKEHFQDLSDTFLKFLDIIKSTLARSLEKFETSSGKKETDESQQQETDESQQHHFPLEIGRKLCWKNSEESITHQIEAVNGSGINNEWRSEHSTSRDPSYLKECQENAATGHYTEQEIKGDSTPTSKISENVPEPATPMFTVRRLRTLHNEFNLLQNQCNIYLKQDSDLLSSITTCQAVGSSTNKSSGTHQYHLSIVAEPSFSKENHSNNPVPLASLQSGIQDVFKLWEFRGFAYIKVSAVVAMTLVDILLLFILQVFWINGDFVCTYASRDQSDMVLTEAVARQDIIVVIASMVCWNLVRMISRLMRRDSNGKRIGLRYFYTWNSAMGISEVLLNLWTASIILASIAILWFHTILCMQQSYNPSNSWTYAVARRLHLMIHVIRCVHGLSDCMHVKGDLKRALQTIISQNKRRFIDRYAKLDLDLTYICDRMIAMALPCVDGAMYRNDIRDVARFFSSRHYGHFIIFNLCEDHEEGGNGNYDTSLLYRQVHKLPCKDHSAPALSTLIFFCEQAVEWLNADPNNVIAIHCQGGKGRTGTFCSALLLWTGRCKTADEAMELFAHRRADPRRRGGRYQGISSPGQIRVLRYLERVLFDSLDFVSSKHLLLTRILMKTTPMLGRRSVYLTFVIETNGMIDYDHCKAFGLLTLNQRKGAKERWEFVVGSGGIAVHGDLNIRFFCFEDLCDIPANVQAELGPGATTIRYGNVTGNLLFFISCHSAFHSEHVVFTKDEIDGAYNKNSSLFHENFSVEIEFSNSVSNAERIPYEILRPRYGASSKISAGMPPSFRFIRLQSAFDSFMQKKCPETRTFYRGEMIYDPHEEDRRVLLYIVDGNAELLFKDKNGAQSYGPRFARMLLGKGDCFGEKKFLFGINRDSEKAISGLFQLERIAASAGPSLCAFSESVTVRFLEIDSASAHIPGDIPGISINDAAVLFEFLAKTITKRVKDAMITAVIAKTNAENIKHDRKLTISVDRHDRVIKQITKRYRIPISEALLFYDNAKIATDDCSLSKGSKGKVLVFSHAIIFKAKGWFLPWIRNQSTELVVPLKRINRVRVNGSHILLDFADEGTGNLVKGALASFSGIFRDDGCSDGNKSNLLNLELSDNYACVTLKRILTVQRETMQITDVAKLNGYPGFKLSTYIDGTQSCDAENMDSERHDLNTLLNQAQLMKFRDGEVIIERGSTERRLYCIYSGVVACKSSCGKVLAKLSQGDVVGEVSFLELGNQGALSRVVAEGIVEVACMFYQTVDLLVNFDKKVGALFFRNLAMSSCLRLEQQYEIIMNTQTKVAVKGGQSGLQSASTLRDLQQQDRERKPPPLSQEACFRNSPDEH